jgi:hypothetical protein
MQPVDIGLGYARQSHMRGYAGLYATPPVVVRVVNSGCPVPCLCCVYIGVNLVHLYCLRSDEEDCRASRIGRARWSFLFVGDRKGLVSWKLSGKREGRLADRPRTIRTLPSPDTNERMNPVG